MSATVSFTTREMADSDLEEVIDLLRVSLGDDPTRPKTSDSFTWKHFANPFGRSIALVAEEGGSLVGLRALMRWDLVDLQGETLRCVRAVDTATHPRMQRKGIFRRLTEEAIEVSRAAGIDMVFNTPNERSGAGYLKMGWSHVGEIHPLVRPALPRLGSSQREEELDRVEPTPFAERVARGLRTPRTPEYWNWRFRSHPAVSYRQLTGARGAAIVRANDRRGRRELLVAEASGSPWKMVRQAARSVGAAYSATWFSPGTPEKSGAMRSLFVPVPGPSLTLVARPLTDLDIDVTSMASWDLAVSDLELL